MGGLERMERQWQQVADPRSIPARPSTAGCLPWLLPWLPALVDT